MISVLYLGQKWVGEACFEILLQSPPGTVRVAGVVSNASDGMWWGTNAVYRRCERDGVPFLDNATRNDASIRRFINELKVDAIICVQHPWILPADVLADVSHRAYNLHNAPLPGYQGHNCCNHAILNGEKQYGVTLHWMVPEADKGDIAFDEMIGVDPAENARSLYDRGIEAGTRVFKQLVECLVAGRGVPKKPMQGTGTFYKRSSLDTLREITDIGDVEDVDRKSRAMFFPPFEPAYFLCRGRKQYVLPANCRRYMTEFRRSKKEMSPWTS